MKYYPYLVLFISIALFSCSEEEPTNTNNTNSTDTCQCDIELDQSRGPCDVTLTFTPTVAITENANNRVITTNCIPNHKVGKFGKGFPQDPTVLNPNAISEQAVTLRVSKNPVENSTYIPLLSTTGVGPQAGPQYSFGVMLNGVELDPIAAEPFPHEGIMSPDVNWEWNLEALNVDIGLDCNNAHVQPTGKYHYHGQPTLYLQNANIPSNKMTLIGYAADGFPIYYKYAYNDAMDSTSGVTIMTTSYQLKSGRRPGDGVTAPCGEYDGVYSNDYEYIDGLGVLDMANGRTGVTPEYPQGTYYYMVTDAYPSVPRYFKGTPSQDFKIGN